MDNYDFKNIDEKYLKRKNIIALINTKEEITVLETLEILNNVRREISKYQFCADENFIMNHRRKYLKSAIEQSFLKDYNRNFLKDLLWNFFEFVSDDYPGDILSNCYELGISIKEFDAMDNEYRKKGIICLQEKNIILEIINKIEFIINNKQISTQYEINNSDNSKKPIFKIENHNFGLRTINTWNIKTWIIYDDLSVKYEIKNGENKIKSHLHNINSDDFKKIVENIEISKSNNCEIQACDGESWNFKQYENGNLLWEKKLGYIYGIESLENICEILINLVKNDLDIFI